MSKYFGDRKFYRNVCRIMIPILIQDVITGFVSLVDNIMVGQVGTEPMSGVAIVNQLLGVFNLCLFGGCAGPGIFGAQFFGKGDTDGVRYSFRMKHWVALSVLCGVYVVLGFWGDDLIMSFLHDSGSGLDLEATFVYAKEYLNIMFLGLIPFAFNNAYAGTLKETGQTRVPMAASITAVLTNMCLNYVLIFGKFGAPVMGVKGAAIATVISRYVEFGITFTWTHTHRDINEFIVGAYKSLGLPAELAKRIAIMGAPLFINEFLYSSGQTMLNQCYSVRGLEVVSAFNIIMTIANLFTSFNYAMGHTISIIVGQKLGSGRLQEAVEDNNKLFTFAMIIVSCIGVCMFFLAPGFPALYNTTDQVKELATDILKICAVFIPVDCFYLCCYFTMRSGGKTLITLGFDSVFAWVASIPLAVYLSRFTQVPIINMYIYIRILDLIRCLMGGYLIKKRVWVNNLVKD